METAMRVGVLVVHGMGEQAKCAERDAMAETLVRVWASQYGRDRVNELGDRPLEGDEPARIMIRNGPDDLEQAVEIEIREVYWADADESPKGSGQRVVHQLDFWRWGLSQWAVKRYPLDMSGLDGARAMSAPVPAGERNVPWSSRLKLFGVGVAFALLGVTWELMRYLVRRIRIAMPGSGVLARYLGDVALYTHNRYRYRPTTVAVTDTPRDAIRRRMVRGLVDMGSRGYDRWYVVAHSLGSIVAHNGLMELAEALPNYFGRRDGGGGDYPQGLKSMGSNVSDWVMRPPRPHWLGDQEAIDRQQLFKNLKGFCTYGSPLDKFATLWPAIVPVNKDTEPLKLCQWVNIFDRMDPVAGSLDRFGQVSGFAPCNVRYRSSWWFLLAHIAYLKAAKNGNGFAERLGKWIAVGEPFDTQLTGRFGGGNVRLAVRYLWWFALSGAALAPLAWLVSMGCDDCVESSWRMMEWAMRQIAGQWPGGKFSAVVCVLAVALAFTFIMPIFRRKEE